MKNKLWTFGDSYTAGILPDIDHFPPYVEYLNYLGISREEFPEGWSYQLSQKLNMDSNVTAIGGASNEEIIINLYSNIPLFKQGDIVIIQWTYMNRYLWAMTEDNYNFENLGGNPFGMFKRASLYTEGDEYYGFIPTEVFRQVGLNKSLPSWALQIHLFEKIITYISEIVGFNVFFWSSDDFIHLSKGSLICDDKKYILGDIVWNHHLKEPNHSNVFLEAIRPLGATSIYQETNELIKDALHLGIKGNEVLCDLFYNHIKKSLYNN